MRYLLDARSAFEAIGDERGVARTRWGEHNVVLYNRGVDAATPILVGLGHTFEANGDVMYQALTAGSIAFLNLLEGRVGAAMHWASRSIARYYGMRDAATTTLTLAACAIGLVDTQEKAAAATMYGAYEGLSERFGLKPPAGLGYVIGTFRPVDKIVASMHADAYAAAYERGAQMTLDEAVAFALEVMARYAEAPEEIADS
jgi:hypothetical protein